jgi:hypothetical protein
MLAERVEDWTMADEDVPACGPEAVQVRQIWSALSLPGMIDVHTQFMPKSVLDKVWHYFDSAGPLVGRAGLLLTVPRNPTFADIATIRGPPIHGDSTQ